MSEDTKQDKSQKEPLTRSEYHGVITSYAGLVMSLIAIVLSVITMYQSHIMETREAVQILRAEDDGYYHFDGEKLFKNFQVTVANNSAIPVSVVEITIERGEESRTFKISDLPDILPLNMESNHTEMITIPWEIPLSDSDKLSLYIAYHHENQVRSNQENSYIKSEMVVSARVSDMWASMTEELKETFTGLDEAAMLRMLDFLSRYSGNRLYNLVAISLSVTLHTAKDNLYILMSVKIYHHL